MTDGRVEIYNKRLSASREQLVAFLDGRPPIRDMPPDVGFPLDIITRWDGDCWLKCGYYTAWGLDMEFYGGHVKVTPAKKDGSAVDVSVVSAWPPLRPYWEWLARRLACQFAEVPRRGRRAGSGVFRNGTDFENAIGAIARELGGSPTEQGVVEYLDHHGWGHVDVRQLRRWCRQFGYKDWQAFLSTL